MINTRINNIVKVEKAKQKASAQNSNINTPDKNACQSANMLQFL